MALMRASSRDISHDGRVTDVTPEYTTVEIVSESACGSCGARGFCGLSESVRKTVEVPTEVGGPAPGEEVTVILRRTMGYKAVWLAYVVPVFLLMVSVLVFSYAGASELVTGLASIGVVGVWYLVIFLFRRRLAGGYAFHIVRKDE